MPTLRKLTQTDIERREAPRQSQRAQNKAQYDEILRPFAPGDYGYVELEPNEKRLTVRDRLRAAATRSGVRLRFLRTAPPVLRFRVGAAEEEEEVVADEVAAAPQLATPASGDVTTAAPAAKRRGRPPKTVAPTLEEAAPTAPARRSGCPSRRV